MKILVCGCDGYIGYPLCANLLKKGHIVVGMDALYKRYIIEDLELESIIPIESIEKRYTDYEFFKVDIARDYKLLNHIYKTFEPDIIINLAQQPSAPYSMSDINNASFTIINNVNGLMNLLWCMRDHTPASHIITLGTMGEYGFPNMDIPEGFFDVEYKGKKDILPFPRQPGSIYHATKVMSSDLGLMLSKIWELRITEINQGIVYGTETDTGVKTRFDFGECFGTMINRAVACAVIEHPIMLYGTGLQTRGYIALEDSIKCLTIAAENPPTDNDSIHGYRVINQMDASYSCKEIAEIVQKIAREKFKLNTSIKYIENPRIEPEVHYYNPEHKKLKKMGWEPSKGIEETIEKMFWDLIPYKETILKYKDKLIPKIKWRPDFVAVKEQ